jgi:predicted thioesterase
VEHSPTTAAPSLERGFRVVETQTTTVGGTLPQPVLATPQMIDVMETAAADLAAAALTTPQTTVGFAVDIRHVAPALLGDACVVRAVVREHEGRRWVFDVSVSKDGELVGCGTHERRVVSPPLAST